MSDLPTFRPTDHPRGRSTPLDRVLPLVTSALSYMLKPGDNWKKWAQVMRHPDGRIRFTKLDLDHFALNTDPVDVLWDTLVQDGRTLKFIEDSLREARLNWAAKFITESVLHENDLGAHAAPIAVAQPGQSNPSLEPQIERLPLLIAPSTEEISHRHQIPTEFRWSSNQQEFVVMNQQEFPQRPAQMNIRLSESDTSNGLCESRELSMTDSQEHIPQSTRVHRLSIAEKALVPNMEAPYREPNCIEKSGDFQTCLFNMNFESGKPCQFNYNDMRTITNNFDENDMEEGGCLIGKGGFAHVFIGKVSAEKQIAVKRMTNNPTKLASKQYTAELDSMSGLNHNNLLPLLGYSDDGPNLCIVYEYMPRGSLHEALRCRKEDALTVKQRMNILTNCSHGIGFLHSINPPLVHRDVKSANILLAEDLTPKLGDFGLARIGPNLSAETTHINTSMIMGTTVYMPPEAFSGEISPAWDCYSFGIVIQEVLTGLRALDSNREEDEKHLNEHLVENCEADDDILALVDQKAGNWSENVAVTLFKLSKRCLEKKKKRAKIAEIQETLESLQ